MRHVLPVFAFVCLMPSSVVAHTTLPSIFGSNMVLQQKHNNKVWGWGDAGDKITVKIAGQQHETTVDNNGHWHVMLNPMDAGGPHRLEISGHDKITFDNVMIGEVWICSGQSNMQWSVNQSNDPDLEKLTANFPNIRLISVPQVGASKPQHDFDGSWQICTPQTVGDFSAVGYFFGRQLHQTLDIPIGLIDNAWGGSAAEAWIKRETIEADDRYNELMEHWRGVEKEFDLDKAEEEFKQKLEEWKSKVATAEQDGKSKPRRPWFHNPLKGNQRPANIYNGVLKPTIGYGIKGVIWYQGESNASRVYQYRHLFPLVISSWRDEWQQGDFPFYWVQLADFRQEKAEPADSDWAELREAQTMTMHLPNTGEAVIVDLGEAVDIHPKNKQDVAKRLARWALARDYGFSDLAHRSPIYKSMQREDGHVILDFVHVGGGLDTFDVNEPMGFTIAGEDKKFHHADAEIVGKGAGRTQIKVWSDDVDSPVAVRYAWADNPICNVQNTEGLPLTPFRTDDWEGITANKVSR